MYFFIFLLLCFVLYLLSNFNKRLKILEKSIAPTNTKTIENLQSEENQSLETRVNEDQVVTQPKPNIFIDWLKEDWLLKLGALLLLIGFGWLATYAFLNNWIGPMGRITIGIFSGTLFMVLGYWKIKKYVNQGSLFLALGCTTVLLTVFAARTMYGFFTPATSLSIMFLSIVFVAMASIKYNNNKLSVLSLVLASIAPMLTDSPVPNEVGLFAYLLVVISGAIWVVAITGQRILTAIALVVVFIYSFTYIMGYESVNPQSLLLFVYSFVALFFLTSTISIVKLADKNNLLNLFTAVGNSLFLIAWVLVAVDKEWVSLVIVAWMLVFVFGAFLIFKATQKKEPFYVYSGIAMLMLAVATAQELEGPRLTVAYIFETAAVILTTYWVLKDTNIVKNVCFLLIGPILLSLYSVTSASWYTGVIHKDFFVILFMALVLLGLGLYFFPIFKQEQNKDAEKISISMLISGSVFAYILIWLSFHAGLENVSNAILGSLLVYTIIGLFSYFYGLENNIKIVKIYGAVLVAGVVSRLLLVDIWDMEISGKIITFFLIGALLVSTAFFGKNSKDKTITNNF